MDSRQHSRYLSKHKVVHILVKMYRRRGRGRAISFYDPLPHLTQLSKPTYKNIVLFAVNVKEYLKNDLKRTYSTAGDHFGVTRSWISQLMTIHEKLPDDFIEKMAECKDQNLIKRFSGKTLLKIAKMSTPDQRQDYIKTALSQ